MNSGLLIYFTFQLTAAVTDVEVADVAFVTEFVVVGAGGQE